MTRRGNPPGVATRDAPADKNLSVRPLACRAGYLHGCRDTRQPSVGRILGSSNGTFAIFHFYPLYFPPIYTTTPPNPTYKYQPFSPQILHTKHLKHSQTSSYTLSSSSKLKSSRFESSVRFASSLLSEFSPSSLVPSILSFQF